MPSKTELVAFLVKEFPRTKVTIEAVGQMGATVRHAVGAAELHPAGTVSGPVLMLAVMVHKGDGGMARLVRKYSGSDFWLALVRHLLNNMASA